MGSQVNPTKKKEKERKKKKIKKSKLFRLVDHSAS
jgi:hypothetical protein